jgi:medium-chain acyl-[acyl-carrier-protein] hydrolase
MMSNWFVRPTKALPYRLRLFCFPFAAGASATYRQWPKGLPPHVEVIGVELPGRGARLKDKPFCQMRPLIEALSDAIMPLLDLNHAFFGHSMGAMISFELARELRLRGAPQLRHLFVSGRRAPQIPDTRPVTYNLPDPELKARLQELNGTPPEVLDHAELMELMLPIIRADFEIVQTYEFTAGEPLQCPITAFGGVDDTEAQPGDLQPWKNQTRDKFELRMLPGDHFFLRSFEGRLLEMLSRSLA